MTQSGKMGSTEHEFDRGFLRTQRSDRTSIISRAVTLIIVFSILAFAIHTHDLTAGFLLLPLAFEFLLLGWVGLFLAYLVVDCPKFTKMSRSPGFTIGSTVAVAAVISFVLAVEDDTFEISRVIPGWQAGWDSIWSTGLAWALIVEGMALLLSTGLEVRRWRRVGGTFVWTAPLGIALRLTAVLLVGLALYFLVMFTAGLGTTWLMETPARRSWVVFAFLLCVEAAALAITVKIHGDLVRESDGSDFLEHR